MKEVTRSTISFELYKTNCKIFKAVLKLRKSCCGEARAALCYPAFGADGARAQTGEQTVVVIQA